MMKFIQIQAIFPSFSEIAVNLIEGLYSTVARFYDFLLDIVSATDVDLFGEHILSFAKIVYVLVGVFMLFRIAISIVNYIINPEQIGDKNKGASKILVNIVLTIVLLLAFSPGGLVFSFLTTLEDAIVGTGNNDGFIDRLIQESSIDTSGMAAGDVSTSNKATKTDSKAKLTCYYYRAASEKCTAYDNVYTNTSKTYVSTDPWFMKISFYDKKVSGSTLVPDSKPKAYYKIYSGSETLQVSSDTAYTFKYHSKFRTYQIEKVSNGSTSTSCQFNETPYNKVKYINGVFSGSFPTKCTQVSIQEGSPGIGLSFIAENSKSDFVGRKDPKDLWNLMIDEYNDYKDKGTAIEGNDELNERLDNDSVSRNLNVDANAVKFANGAATTFYTCNNDDGGKCDALDNIFVNNEEISKLVGDKTISMDFFASVIAAIALIIFFTLLSVTVVIRNLKLMLLQVLAPIAFVCGINPNDKIRSRWFSMYFATYCELFLYLISIKIVLALLSMGLMDNVDGIKRLFVMIGLLMFAKLVPSFISKLFGIEAASGTFKEAAGMLKSGAGIAAAGSLWAATTLGGIGARSYGAWKNTNTDGLSRTEARNKKLKNALAAGGMGAAASVPGLFRSIGAGAKGNVTAGASASVAATKDAMSKYDEGIMPGDIVKQSTLGRMGMSVADRVDRAQRVMMRKLKGMGEGGERFDKMKSTAKDTKLYKNIAGQKNAEGNTILDENKQSEFAEVIAEASLMGEEKGTEHIRTWLNENCVTRTTVESQIVGGGTQVVSTPWWNEVHKAGLWEGKEADIIKDASRGYKSFLDNSTDIKNLLADDDLLDKLKISEKDIALIRDETAPTYKRQKAINGVISKYIREEGRKMQDRRDEADYVASAAAREKQNSGKK